MVVGNGSVGPTNPESHYKDKEKPEWKIISLGISLVKSYVV